MIKEIEQRKECNVCNSTGFVEFVLPLPLSNGEIVERTEERCPVCGKEE